MGGFLTAANLMSDPYYFMALSDDAIAGPSSGEDDSDWITMPDGSIGQRQPQRRFKLPQPTVAPPPQGIDQGVPFDPPTESPNSVLLRLALSQMAGAAPQANAARPGPRLAKPGERPDQFPSEPGMPMAGGSDPAMESFGPMRGRDGLWHMPDGTVTTPPFNPASPGQGGPPPVAQWPGDTEPGKGSTWKQKAQWALPRMINAGVAAVATPSIAGGGAMDIARAMMGADKYQSGKDAEVYERQKERRKEYFDEALKQSQVTYHNASAEAARMHGLYYMMTAQGRVEPKMAQIVVQEYLAAKAKGDEAGAERAWDKALELAGHAPKESYTDLGNGYGVTKSGQRVEIDPDKARNSRVAELRKMTGVPEATPDAAFMNDLKSKDRILFDYIMTGKMQNEPKDATLNEYNLALRVAGGDPQAAWDLVTKRDQTRNSGLMTQGRIDQRQTNTIMAQALTNEKNNIIAAETRYNAQVAKLNAQRNSPSFGATQNDPQWYEHAMAQAGAALATEKNDAVNTTNTIRAQIGVPPVVQPGADPLHQYPNPSPAPSPKSATPPQKSPATGSSPAPKPVAQAAAPAPSQVKPPGAKYNVDQVVNLKDGRRVKITGYVKGGYSYAPVP